MAERRGPCGCHQADQHPLSEAELFAAYGAEWEAEVTRIRRMLATRKDPPRTASAIRAMELRRIR